MIFKIKAVNLNGEIIKGNYKANNKKELYENLQKKNFFIYFCRRKFIICKKLFYKISTKDLSVFCRDFNLSLKAGISIYSALSLIGNHSSNKRIKERTNEILDSITKGETLAASMERQFGLFPNFMIDMIHIGEESGRLEVILYELYKFYDKEYKNKDIVSKALIYPFMLLVTALFVVIFIVTTVVPLMLNSILSIVTEVPKSAKFFIWINQSLPTLKKVLFIILCLIMIIIFVFRFFEKKYKKFRITHDKLKLKIPIIKNINSYIIVCKISKALSLLLCSGINLIEALYIIGNTINNEYIKQLLDLNIKEIEKGKKISSLFKELGIYKELWISMICIGEEIGNLSNTFLNISNMCEEELNFKIDQGLKLLEPLLIIFLAIFIGGIIILGVKPMIDTMQNIS